MTQITLNAIESVICRVGSLEKLYHQRLPCHLVICRVGSLENQAQAVYFLPHCYLPSRQFRNTNTIRSYQLPCYLPSRQFRKCGR